GQDIEALADFLAICAPVLLADDYGRDIPAHQKTPPRTALGGDSVPHSHVTRQLTRLTFSSPYVLSGHAARGGPAAPQARRQVNVYLPGLAHGHCGSGLAPYVRSRFAAPSEVIPAVGRDLPGHRHGNPADRLGKQFG